VSFDSRALEGPAAQDEAFWFRRLPLQESGRGPCESKDTGQAAIERAAGGESRYGMTDKPAQRR
jgi:hypothetical protein